MKKYYYLTKKEGNDLQIYYKLMNGDGVTQYFQTQTQRLGNKRIRLKRTLMKNNWPIVTKRLVVINPDFYSLNLSGTWKEIDQEEMLSYLRRGNPDDTARSYLFAFFGYNIFGLTNLEREYFKASFHNLDRLTKFYHVVKGECRYRGTGYTYRSYGGRSVLITPGKIKKAMMELFGVIDLQEVLYKKNDGKRS